MLSDIQGRITRIAIHEGDMFKKGQFLLEIDDAVYQAAVSRARGLVVSAQSDFLRSRANEDQARRSRDRALELPRADSSLTTREAVEQALTAYDIALANTKASEAGRDQAKAALQEAQDNLRKTRIIAPISGRVTRLAVEEGEVAIPGTFSRDVGLLATIAELSVILAKVQVDETDVVRLSIGDSVEVSIDACDEHGEHVDVVPAARSTGSILKPLLYPSMLEAGEVLPAQLVPDVPTHIGSFHPENFDRAYSGAVPAARALARSLNVRAVRMLRAHGVERFAAVLRRLGVTTLTRPGSHYGLALVLGGAEGSLWDVTGVYAGVARSALATTPGAARSAFFPPTVGPRDPGEPGHVASPLSPAASYLTLQVFHVALQDRDQQLHRLYPPKETPDVLY